MRMMRPAVEIRFESIISGHGDLRNAPFSLALIRHSNRVSAKIRFGCRETRFYEAETKAPKRPPKSLAATAIVTDHAWPQNSDSVDGCECITMKPRLGPSISPAPIFGEHYVALNRLIALLGTAARSARLAPGGRG